MYINQQKMIHLPVVTRSGMKLGHVHDFEIDIDTHQIRKYIVVSGLITKDTYHVHPAQIVSITEEKIVVEDAVEKQAENTKEKPASRSRLDTVMPRDLKKS